MDLEEDAENILEGKKDRRVGTHRDWYRKRGIVKQTVLRRKLGFFGHVMRSNGLEKDMMLAYREGRRKQGRPRKRWMDEVHETTGMNLEELKEATSERKQWRKMDQVGR